MLNLVCVKYKYITNITCHRRRYSVIYMNMSDISSIKCFNMLLLKVLYGPVSGMKLWHSSLQKRRRGIDNIVRGGTGMKNQVLVGYWVIKNIQVRVE